MPASPALRDRKLDILAALAGAGFDNVDLVILDTDDVVLRFQAVSPNRLVFAAQGFERGTPKTIRRQIEMCWEQAGPGGAYIMAASDHFFEGDPENIRTYVEIAREFRY